MGSKKTKQAVPISCKLKETETNSFSVVHELSNNQQISEQMQKTARQKEQLLRLPLWLLF